jgi:hypothetical protein
MAKGIGSADDYYRVRLMHVDDVDAPEFEWREDILWRTPQIAPTNESQLYRIEAVALEDPDRVTPLGVFESTADAYEALATATEDLSELTRSEFEDRYFPVDS